MSGRRLVFGMGKAGSDAFHNEAHRSEVSLPHFDPRGRVDGVVQEGTQVGESPNVTLDARKEEAGEPGLVEGKVNRGFQFFAKIVHRRGEQFELDIALVTKK